MKVLKISYNRNDSVKEDTRRLPLVAGDPWCSCYCFTAKNFVMARFAFPVFFIISHLSLLCLAQKQNRSNPSCPSFPCGKLGNISFPFSNRSHPECGLLTVDDCDKPLQKIQLGKDGPWFQISSISQDNSVFLHDPQLSLHDLQLSNNNWKICKLFKNVTIPNSPVISFEISYDDSVITCPLNDSNIPTRFSSLCNNSKHSIFYHNFSDDMPLSIPPQCSPIRFPVKKTQNSVEFINLYTGLFLLKVHVNEECNKCHYRRGQCLIDSTGKNHCSKTGNETLGLKIGLAISAIGLGILVILAFLVRKTLSSDNSSVIWKKKTESCQNIEAFLKNQGSLAPKRHSYSDVKKMTNSFKHKLGQGGYGDVYKGNLLDGRSVAVKVLNETKGNGEEFINEVASISRTSHVNIVTLLGFCFEGRRRALIYEFVSNGSLEKFIYRKRPFETDQKLKWETLYKIAIGIARGLEYLHRGCSTRIFHLDIKPHNILLDEDFCPKISDFGLAKICPQKQSIVSMTGARGTIGYIAPEVFCRNFGEVSYKSDVYSYGMMVFEMTGGRTNTNAGVDHSSEVYFPHWVYKRLELDEELGLQGAENEEDKECAKKMMIVSLWCIQNNPSDRPAMNRVVEMLEGSLDSLQIPPKPFLSSPGSHPAFSTTLISQTQSSQAT